MVGVRRSADGGFDQKLEFDFDQGAQRQREIEIDRSRVIELAETDRRKALELAQQSNEIEIAQHSKRRNEALAEAENSRALTVKAEEAVISARELERAGREKALAIVAASRDIEAKGMAVVQQAQSEQDAATRRSETVRLLATAEFDAEKLRQESADHRNDVEARGRRALNEAENTMSAEAMSLRARLAAIDRIEGIVRESAKPLEHISDIKIIHVDGLGGGAGADPAGGSVGSVSDQVMNSALKYKLQAPLVNSLLAAAGLDPEDVTSTLKP